MRNACAIASSLLSEPYSEARGQYGVIMPAPEKMEK
jgi:hypothetical protein